MFVESLPGVCRVVVEFREWPRSLRDTWRSRHSIVELVFSEHFSRTVKVNRSPEFCIYSFYIPHLGYHNLHFYMNNLYLLLNKLNTTLTVCVDCNHIWHTMFSINTSQDYLFNWILQIGDYNLLLCDHADGGLLAILPRCQCRLT